MIEFQVEVTYKKVSIRIPADFDLKVRELEGNLGDKKITYNEIMRTLLHHGYEVYKAENENREYACEEIVFCQCCGKLAPKFRKFTYREEVYKFCTICVEEGNHIVKLRTLEQNYQSKQLLYASS